MFITKRSSDIKGYFFILTTVFIYGLAWTLGRWMVAENYGATIPAIMIANIRYIIVILCFLPLVFYMEKDRINIRFFKSHWKEISLMGFLNVTIYQFGYLYGEKYTAAGDAALVFGMSPILILLISSILIKENLTHIKIFGAMLALIGVLFIVGFSPNDQIPINERLLGDFLVFIGAFSYATYTVLLKRLFNKYSEEETKPSSIQIIFWVSIVGLIFLYPISLVIYPEYLIISSYLIIPDRIWIGILFLALFSTVYAYVAFSEAVKLLGAGRTGIFVNLVPVIGVGTSVFIGEVFDPITHIASFILIFTGISLVNKKENESSKIKDDFIN